MFLVFKFWRKIEICLYFKFWYSLVSNFDTIWFQTKWI